jgi:cytochrome c5
MQEARGRKARKKRGKESEQEMRVKMIVCGLIVALVVVTGLLAACGGPAAPETAEPSQEEQPTAQPPAGDGAALLEERCTVCHGLERTTQAQKTRDEWEQTVTRMVGKGAQLAEDEQGTLIEHLAATHGP